MIDTNLIKNSIKPENQNLDIFRTKVQKYCRLAGRNLGSLAESLKFSRSNLSHKLNGIDNAALTHAEVKIIIQTLADWQAINSKFEAVELLELMNLGAGSFAVADWHNHPLNKLETDFFSGVVGTFAGEISNPEVTAVQLNSKTAIAVTNIIKMLSYTGDHYADSSLSK